MLDWKTTELSGGPYPARGESGACRSWRLVGVESHYPRCYVLGPQNVPRTVTLLAKSHYPLSHIINVSIV